MRYVKPQYYDEFRCIADQCPDTCCAGWQIVIDEEALEKYSRVTGVFGNRLYASIDWREGTFRQKKGRCSFLNRENLCDLYQELGEGALCRTCSMYPRHIEEFDGLRELSLSLSCPVAAKMILTCKEPLRLSEEETDEKEEFAEEFEEFDTLMFTQLEDARTVIFAAMQDRQIPVEDRIRQVMEMAQELQECIDEERYCDVDEVIGKYQRDLQAHKADGDKCRALGEDCGEGEGGTFKSRYDRMCREYQVFHRLEHLSGQWSDVLGDAWENLYAQGEEQYQYICREFDNCFGRNSSMKEEWSLFAENLMLFFIYTYFCGAVYDDCIYSKAALSEFSVRWIQELVMAEWAAKTKYMVVSGKAGDWLSSFDWQRCIDIAYRYAREIEHSDDNLNTLEEWLLTDISQ